MKRKIADNIAKIARPNKPICILLLMGCLAMWLPDFLQLPFPTGALTISLPVHYTFRFNPYLQLAATMLLVLLNGLLISGLMQRFGIQRKLSLLPVLFYTLCVSACPAGRYALEAQLAIALFIVILPLVKSMFKDGQSVEQAFLVSLLATVAAMFLPDMLLLVPVLWLAFLQEKAFSGRVFLASLIGVCTVVIFWTAYLAYYRCFGLFAEALGGVYGRMLPEFGNGQWRQPAYFLLLFVAGSFGIISYYSNIYRESIPTRAIVGVTIILSLFTLPLVFFPAANGLSAFPLLAFWVSIHGAYLCLSGQTVSRALWFVYLFAVNIAGWFIL